MLLQRSFIACLFGVYFCLLWREVMGPSQVAVNVECAAAPAAPGAPSVACRGPARPPEPAVNVIDVAAAAATPELVTQLLRLAADEQVVAVDDHAVANDFMAGAWLAARFEPAGKPGAASVARAAIAGGDYIDLTVQGASGSRRVLVLFH